MIVTLELQVKIATSYFGLIFFSSAFILNSVLYGVAYILYMHIEDKLDSIPRRIIIVCLGVSAVLLLLFMVLMNHQVDKTKDTLLYLHSYENLAGQYSPFPSKCDIEQASTTDSLSQT
jgi:uncharacterized membrane protein required for colicin V production